MGKLIKNMNDLVLRLLLLGMRKLDLLSIGDKNGGKTI